MEKQQSQGVEVINNAHWILVVSVLVLILSLYSHVPPLNLLAHMLLVATLFTFSVIWYWRNGNIIAYCLSFMPILAINSLLGEMSVWQYSAVILGIFSLYLWGLKTYLLMLVADIEEIL